MPRGECDYTTIQAAVDAASDGDTIKVAAGTYTDVNTYGGLAQVAYINKTISILGGYTTTNWIAADPVANPSTLDAQGQGRVLCITGDITCTLEGLRITGGDAAGLGGMPGTMYSDAGGGVYVMSSTITLASSQVASNTADYGAGVYVHDGVATVTGNTIPSNTAEGYGGGLYLQGSSVMLRGNTLVSNTSNDRGGGLFLSSSDGVVSGNRVSGNTARYSGGGLVLYGLLSPTVAGNTVISNSAGVGGGLFLWFSSATVRGNRIVSNTASHGGGVCVFDSGATVSGNLMSGNIAKYGGGLEVVHATSGVPFDTDPTLINNLIVANQASEGGSGICVKGSSPRLLHNTIALNSGGDGSAVFVDRNDTGKTGIFYGTTSLVNTVLVSHTVGISVTARNTVSVESTLWHDNTLDWGGTGVVTGNRNHDYTGAPAFADPDGGDYHIGPGSAALDRGVGTDVMLDMDDQPRAYGAPDLGADEYWPAGALKHVHLPLILREH